MDEEDALVQQLVKSLAFEVEAVAAENIIKFSTNGTPLNVKVRVRNKDEPRLVQRGLVSIPRIANQVTTPEKIHLISSDQTILSFNVYMETDLEKHTQTPKSRKHGFNFLKFGGCLGTSVGEDDDEGAYIPETSSKSQSAFIIDEIEGSQEKVKLNMENSKIVARNQKGFFGKCKPGGCLDPPFSEDKCPYGLQKTQLQPRPDLAINKPEEIKDKRSKSISSVEPQKLKFTDEPIKKDQLPSRSEVESKPLVDIFAPTSSSQNSLGSKHSNIITYPSRLSSSEMIRENQDTRKRNKSKTFTESPRQSNENPLAYFVPPKATVQQKEEERKYSIERSSDQIKPDNDYVKDGTSQNNGNRKRTLRNRSIDISSINNAKKTEMQPIAVSASQGRKENYPKSGNQTSTDLTFKNNYDIDNAQERKKSDILLLTKINNTKNAEIKPITFSASQVKDKIYPKRAKQASKDLTLNRNDNVQIIPLQEMKKSDILLLTSHVDQIENLNNSLVFEMNGIAVSGPRVGEENYPKSFEQTSTDPTLNDKENVRKTPLQGREKNDILLTTPHMNQIKNVNDLSNVLIESVPVTSPNDLDDFDNKDDLRFQTKSQLHNQGILDNEAISSDNLFKKIGDEKDDFYDARDKTQKFNIMRSAKALESEKDQKLEQSETSTEPQSRSKKTKLTLKTNPNDGSSLQNLLDRSDLNGIDNIVSDTSNQDTHTKAKKDTNTYPSTCADADKIQMFPQNSDATKSQTQKSMVEKQNEDFIRSSNGKDVSKYLDPGQPLKQEFPGSDVDLRKSQSNANRTQEAFQEVGKETTKTLDAAHKIDTINKLIESPDIFSKQTYGSRNGSILETEINNGIAQDQNNQQNNLYTREFKNKATEGKQEEKDIERIADINDIREDDLNKTDIHIDSMNTANADPDRQKNMNNLKMQIYSSQTKNGHSNMNDIRMSESHVIQPFMIENEEQGIDDIMSGTQTIRDTSTEKHQAHKKLLKTASHDSNVSKNKEYTTYSAHSLGSHYKMTSTYDDSKKPVNIQYKKYQSSGPKTTQPSSIEHVIIQNDLLLDHNEIPGTESREKRSSLVKMPFAATGSDLRIDEASKMIPLQHKVFPIVESTKSVEKQIEDISTLQNLTYGGSNSENDDKSVLRGRQARQRVLDRREIQLVGSNSALNLNNLDKEAKIWLHNSDKKVTEIIGLPKNGDKTNIDDASSNYSQPKYQNAISEFDGRKMAQNQLSSDLHQDFIPFSLGLPSVDTDQIDNIGFKSPEPIKLDGNVNESKEKIFHNSISMDRDKYSATPLTSTSDIYFKDLNKSDRNAQSATKSDDSNNINISRNNINQLADQFNSIIITDEINKDVTSLPINYTPENGTTLFNTTMEGTSAITYQKTSGIMANNETQYNPPLSTTPIAKIDSEFNAANLSYADAETMNFKADAKSYDDISKITSTSLKSTFGGYNLDKTVPQFDKFTDDTGLGVNKDTNNKKVKNQNDITNFMKNSNSRKSRRSKKSIDETRRMLLSVTKPSNNKSTPVSKFLDTDSMNQTNQERFHISATPTEKDKFELLLNMKFQTYVNENNNLVVQTLNPLTEAQDLKSYKVTVINSLIRPGNEINIQVDSEHNLNLSLSDNCHKGGHQKHEELKAYQRAGPGATENEIVLHKNLTLLYESELVPLHNAIMGLTAEINALSANQELLKAKLQGSKRNRSTRITPVSKHCGCRRS